MAEDCVLNVARETSNATVNIPLIANVVLGVGVQSGFLVVMWVGKLLNLCQRSLLLVF